jgi:hypothetical protein
LDLEVLTMSRSRVPDASDIDPDFRPKSHFTARNLHVPMPSGIAGQGRREEARERVTAGEDVPEQLLAPRLADEERTSVGRIHPMLVGAEYLPSMDDDVVEIARISLKSVTYDQISVRARRAATGFLHSIVDEYGDDRKELPWNCGPERPPAPLTLGELAGILDGACHHEGTVLGIIVQNVVEFGADPDEYRNFVTVESDFYPDLGRYYEGRIRAWFTENAAREDDKEAWGRAGRFGIAGCYDRPHHCRSHGTPSPSPSIFVPGQLRRNHVASAHEVICEQRMRPSHLYWTAGAIESAAGDGAVIVSGAASGRAVRCWYCE